MLLSNQNPSASFEEGSQKAPVTGQRCGQGTASLVGRLSELPGHCQAFWQRKLLTQTQIMKLKNKLSLLLPPPRCPRDHCPTEILFVVTATSSHPSWLFGGVYLGQNSHALLCSTSVLQVLHYLHATCLNHCQRLTLKFQVPESYLILADQLQT